MDRSILLTGATGNIGQVVAAELTRRGVPFVAMARSGTNRAALTARGITAIHGDFDDPASLAPALCGVHTAYLVCTPDEHLVRRETAFIRAAQAAGVRRTIKCSAYMAGDAASTENLRSHGAIERALRASGMESTIVRPHGFMQTFTLFSWDLIQKAGVLSNPTGDGGMPLVDVRAAADPSARPPASPGPRGLTRRGRPGRSEGPVRAAMSNAPRAVVARRRLSPHCGIFEMHSVSGPARPLQPL